MERESYWSDDDGSSSDEYNSEEEDPVGDGSKMVVDSDGKSDSEGIENQHSVMHLQDSEISAPQETCMPELVPRPPTTPTLLSAVDGASMPPPMMIGQQESTIQAENMQTRLDYVPAELTETSEHEPEDSNTGRRTSGRVRKRTQVDGRCECDTEITAEEKEEGTQVMRCKARGCETGWVRGTYLLDFRVGCASMRNVPMLGNYIFTCFVHFPPYFIL